MAVERTVVQASPRCNGTCAHVAATIVENLHAAYPGDHAYLIELCKQQIAPCTGCNQCRQEGECSIQDDMDDVRVHIDAAAEVFVVSPVYFAGPPARYKALLDRLQPYYWVWYAQHKKAGREQAKRPVSLVVIGDGGDPHGYDPLVVCTRSAFTVAGFRLAQVVPCIGFQERDAVRIVSRELFGSSDR